MFPLDPNQYRNSSPRVDPAAPTDMRAFEASLLTIVEPARRVRNPSVDARTFLRSVAPELTPELMALLSDELVKDLTTMALRGLMEA